MEADGAHPSRWYPAFTSAPQGSDKGSGWVWLGEAAADEPMQLSFALRPEPEAIAALEKRFWHTASPDVKMSRVPVRGVVGVADARRYTREEAHAVTAPTRATLETLRDHLIAAGARAQRDDGLVELIRAATVGAAPDSVIAGGFVHITIPVSVARTLLGGCGGIHAFHHAGAAAAAAGSPGSDMVPQRYLRCADRYTLPEDLASRVAFVGGAARLQRHVGTAAARGFIASPEAAATAARAASSAPTVLSARATDRLQVVFVPRCPDGSPLTHDPSVPCNSTSHLRGSSAAGATGVTLDRVELVATQSAQTYSVTNKTYVSDLTKAGECLTCLTAPAAHRSQCLQLMKSMSLSNDTVFCIMLMTPSMSFAPLEGTNVTVDLSLMYSDNTTSAHATAGDLWPAPMATPEMLKETYEVPASLKGTFANNSQCVVEFLNQWYDPADLSAYLAAYGGSGQIDHVHGPNNASVPGGEATLDVEVILGLASDVHTEFWSFAGLRNNSAPPSNSNQEPFLQYMMDVAAEPDATVPLVHSVSYDDDEDSMPSDFTDRLNEEFMKAGLRGLTLLFAAGDDGVGGETVRVNGTAACPVFHPAFPASSPYVLAIGGTQLLRDEDGSGKTVLKEHVSDSVTGSFITTGGGFSGRYPPPDFMGDAIANYLDATNPIPPANYFNASGRGYPDISGIATLYPIILAGEETPIGGTSASTPLIAALLSLINDARLSEGVHSVGYINHILYATQPASQLFHDVVEGNNRCSAVPTNCCAYGFFSGQAWDATTGLGTPHFGQLYDLFAGGR